MVDSKKKTIKILWALAIILIGISFSSFSFSFLEKSYGKENNKLVATVESATKEEAKYFYTTRGTPEKPKVSAKAYLVGDLDTGEVILSQNQDKIYPIASVTKLMTASVASEIAKEDDIVTVSKEAISTYGKNGELKTGEKIKASLLLYPLLLESSNDAAEALAIHFGRDNFMEKMNMLASKLKMENTFYDDPSGLSPENKSTVSDIFKLTGYIRNKQAGILDITKEKSYSDKKHNWSNISQFLKQKEYLGGKSGYTDPAKQTVVSTFSLPLGENTVRPIAIVLLQSNDRKKDVEKILQYLNKNIYYGGKSDANTNWVEEKVGMPDIKDPNFVTLLFAGDIMLDRGVESSVNKNFGGDYSSLFDKSKELTELLNKSDISFANLEGPASSEGADLKNLYSFRMNPVVIPTLKGAGFDILSVANNHAGDWGHPAFADTLARLKENEISYTGGGNNKNEAETPVIIEKYGMKIGYLGFSDVGPSYLKTDTDKAGILLANDPRASEIIENASRQVDYLVVSFHFGDEYKTVHNKRQETLAHMAIDSGAKIVTGHHPHVVEDTEIYKNGFIAYSLGNFIFDQSWSKPTMEGMILEIKLNRDGNMTIRKNPTKLNSVFQIEKVVLGKEEKIKF